MDQGHSDSAADIGAGSGPAAVFEKPPMFELRIATMCGAAFVISGLYVPFFPVWLDSIGMDADRISLILAVAMLARIFSAPFIMAASDRSGERVRILIALSLASVVCALFFLFTRSYAALVAVSIALGVVSGSQIPITEAIVELARAGLGIGILSEWVADAYLSSGRGLVTRRLGGQPLLRRWRLAVAPAHADLAPLLAEAISGARPLPRVVAV